MATLQLRPDTSALLVRPGPGTRYDPPIGVIRAGERVESIATSDDGHWRWVEAPGGMGWAGARYLVPAAAAPRRRLADVWLELGLVEDLLPTHASNRPRKALRPTSITVHNTANDGPGADALMHARYMRGSDARSRRVSWHYTVDDRRVVRHIPDNEQAWHAGPANQTSIGVEICEHRGIDQDAANERAALLVAALRVQHGIDEVRTHQSWTGKDCPRRLLATAGGWDGFAGRVEVLGGGIER